MYGNVPLIPVAVIGVEKPRHNVSAKTLVVTVGRLLFMVNVVTLSLFVIENSPAIVEMAVVKV